MPGMSTYLENMALNWFRGAAFAAPPTVYVALFDGDPTDAGTGGTENTVKVRAAGRPVATFAAPALQSIANSAVVDYGNAAQATQFSHFALYDAAAGGNMLASAALAGGAQAVTVGTAVRFAVGALVVAAS